MPAALALSTPSSELVEQYLSAMQELDRKTGRFHDTGSPIVLRETRAVQ